MSANKVAPHDFTPVSRWRHRKLCRHCFFPKWVHPIVVWADSRPFGDLRRFSGGEQS